MSDEKRYTLADLRLAYADGAAKWGAYRDHAEEEAARAFPDPEPPERWVHLSSDILAALCDNGVVTGRSHDAPDDECEVIVQTIDDVRALASLLPRVPVTVTEEMVEKAMRAYWDRGHHGVTEAIRAALSAVASDLAQPVHACQHTAQWWGVIDNKGSRVLFVDEAEARKSAARWNRNVPDDAPHRVIPLAEVDHA
jgi:hypothetical protein